MKEARAQVAGGRGVQIAYTLTPIGMYAHGVEALLHEIGAGHLEDVAASQAQLTETKQCYAQVIHVYAEFADIVSSEVVVDIQEQQRLFR